MQGVHKSAGYSLSSAVTHCAATRHRHTGVSVPHRSLTDHTCIKHDAVLSYSFSLIYRCLMRDAMGSVTVIDIGYRFTHYIVHASLHEMVKGFEI